MTEAVREGVGLAGKDSDDKNETWLKLPASVKRVFDKFPLQTLQENSFPQRISRRQKRNVLFIFNPAQSSPAAPSWNPSCLKWQAYLKFRGIDFETARSNNHASPSGALPYLQPPSTSRPSTPISTKGMMKWMVSQGCSEELSTSREDVYMTLVDQSIRNAWLYYLYVDESNFDAVAYPTYVSTTSSTRFVRSVIASQLREAAKTELLKTQPIIDGGDLLHVAMKALESLATLLGDDEYFFGYEQPTLFDATLFAYTQTLLDDTVPWQNRALVEKVETFTNLVDHRDRILKLYFNS